LSIKLFGSVVMARSHFGTGARDRPHDAIVRAAAAQMTVEGGGDFAPARVLIAGEQGGCRNQDAREAIAALTGLLVEERLLQRRQHAAG
jgi:hypothetical protein